LQEEGILSGRRVTRLGHGGGEEVEFLSREEFLSGGDFLWRLTCTKRATTGSAAYLQGNRCVTLGDLELSQARLQGSWDPWKDREATLPAPVTLLQGNLQGN
jgi:hypothetical protein